MRSLLYVSEGDMKMMRIAPFCVAAVMLPAAAFGALVGAATTPAGSGFAGACAGNETFSGLPHAGEMPNNGVSHDFGDGHSYFTCAFNTVGGAGGIFGTSASNSGSFFGNPWSKSASSTAGPQQIHISGTNTGSPDTEFSGSFANGGWNENFTLQITDPSVHITSATQGYWIAPLHIDGTLAVTSSGNPRAILDVSA